MDLQQTNNVKNRVTGCGRSGVGDAWLAVTSQWQRPCRPSLCSWPSLTWWLGFSAGLELWERVITLAGCLGDCATLHQGEGTWQRGGFVSPNNVLSSPFNPGNSLQLEPPTRWGAHVWKCVCLCVCIYLGVCSVCFALYEIHVRNRLPNLKYTSIISK